MEKQSSPAGLILLLPQVIPEELEKKQRKQNYGN